MKRKSVTEEEKSSKRPKESVEQETEISEGSEKYHQKAVKYSGEAIHKIIFTTQKAAKLDNENSFKFACLAGYYKKQGNFVKAAENLEKALESDKYNENPNILANLAFCYQEQGNFSKAIENYEKATVKLDDKDPFILTALACCYKNQGNFSKAIENYEKVAKLACESIAVNMISDHMGSNKDSDITTIEEYLKEHSSLYPELANRLKAILSQKYKEDKSYIKEFTKLYKGKLPCELDKSIFGEKGILQEYATLNETSSVFLEAETHPGIELEVPLTGGGAE